MPRGIRYTDEQKKQMRERAVVLKTQGATQKDICSALGITPVTLNRLMDVQGARRRGRKSRTGPKGRVQGISSDSFAIQLELKRKRLEEVEQELSQLASEKKHLEDELKELYKKLGEQVFGKTHPATSPAASSSKSRS
jgi:hypothetical protein